MQSVAFNLPDRPENHRPYKQSKDFIIIPTCLYSDLSIGACTLYGFLCKHAGKSDHCYPGQDKLAAEMNLSVSQICYYLNELESCGLIRRKRRGNGKTNFYYFPINPEDDTEPPEQPKEARQWEWRGNVAYLWAKTGAVEASETETTTEPDTTSEPKAEEPVETGTPSETPTPGIDIADIISVISESERESCRPIIEKFLQSHDAEYVMRGCKYSMENFNASRKIPFPAFLKMVLEKHWHKDWKDTDEIERKWRERIDRENELKSEQYQQENEQALAEIERIEQDFESLTEDEKQLLIDKAVRFLEQTDKPGLKVHYRRYLEKKKRLRHAEARLVIERFIRMTNENFMDTTL